MALFEFFFLFSWSQLVELDRKRGAGWVGSGLLASYGFAVFLRFLRLRPSAPCGLKFLPSGSRRVVVPDW